MTYSKTNNNDENIKTTTPNQTNDSNENSMKHIQINALEKNCVQNFIKARLTFNSPMNEFL